jgi:LysM repeat protein
MGTLRQIGAGFLLGVIAIAAVIGGFALSKAEGGAAVVPSVSPSAIIATNYPTIPVLTDTPQPVATEAISPTPEATFTLPPSPTPPPPPTSCPPPAGWVPVLVQGYDTLFSVAVRYQTSTSAIKQGNCLFSDQLVVGSYLYVPFKPTATFVPCRAPYGWVLYYVVSGDTLYNISVRYRVTWTELQRANCMGNSTFIAVGKPIRVPNVATSTSSLQTATWTASPTGAATSTGTASPTLEVTATPTVNLGLTATAEAQTAAAAAQTAAALTAAAETQAASVAATQTAAAAATQTSAALTEAAPH